MSEWLTFAGIVIAAFITSISGVMLWRSQKRLVRVDALDKYDQIISRQADELDELRSEQREDRCRIAALEEKGRADEREKATLSRHIAKLEHHVDMLTNIIKTRAPDLELPPRPVQEEAI